MVWQTGTDFLLVAIPMFVLLRACIAARMYDGIVTLVSWLSSGLMHSNFGSSALFAATSGSSVATIGTVAVPVARSASLYRPQSVSFSTAF